MPKTLRKSVPLSEEDATFVNELRDIGTEQAAALREIADLRVTDTSEAAILHALLTLGIERVRDAVDDHGYEQLAAAYKHDPDEVANRLATRQHRNRTTDRWGRDD